MSIHAPLRSNLKFLSFASKSLIDFSFFVKAWRIAGLFFVPPSVLGFALVLTVFASFGCASNPSQAKVLSSIDSQFHLHRLQRDPAPQTAQPKSPGVSFYQSVLRSTLNSECQYFPSDSAFAQLQAKHCSPLKTMLKSFARFSLEPEAAQLGRPIVRVEQKIHFANIPEDCRWFD
jgi:hypothetical protein